MLKLLLRNAVPLMLLALAVLVWGERCLPGREEAVETLGEDGFLRFVVGLLCLFTYVQWLERERMADAFTRILKLFRDFHEERVRSATGEPSGAQRREAVKLLIGSLGAGDPELRARSLEHLRRITGQDLGEDQAAWNAWLASQSGSEEAPKD